VLWYSKRLVIVLTWLASYLYTKADMTVVRYANSTVVVNTDIGCCSWPFYR